jgi:hypothetical protein
MRRTHTGDKFAGFDAGDLPADPRAAYDFVKAECNHMRRNFHPDRTDCHSPIANSAFIKINATCTGAVARARGRVPRSMSGGRRIGDDLLTNVGLLAVIVAMATFG